MSIPNDRSIYTTYHQFDMYCKYLDQKYRSRNFNITKEDVEKEWDNLCKKLNKTKNGPVLTTEQWTKRFTTWKSRIRIKQHRIELGNDSRSLNKFAILALNYFEYLSVNGQRLKRHQPHQPQPRTVTTTFYVRDTASEANRSSIEANLSDASPSTSTAETNVPTKIQDEELDNKLPVGGDSMPVEINNKVSVICEETDFPKEDIESGDNTREEKTGKCRVKRLNKSLHSVYMEKNLSLAYAELNFEISKFKFFCQE